MCDFEAHYPENTSYYNNNCNAFLHAAIIANKYHYTLEIDPESIKFLIIQQFKIHFCKLPFYESLDLYGEERVVIDRDDFIRGDYNDWESELKNIIQYEAVSEDSKEIELREIIETCLLKELTSLVYCSQEVEYDECEDDEYDIYPLSFNYKPVIVSGSVYDWEYILKLLKSIHRYIWRCYHWTQSLEPIIVEFINIVKGNFNKKFWRGMIIPEDTNSRDSHNTTYRGWIKSFFPNIIKDQFTIKDTPNYSNIIKFKWNYFDQLLPMKFGTKFGGVIIDKDRVIVKPQISWYIEDLTKSNY